MDGDLKTQAGKPKLLYLVGLVILTAALFAQFNASAIITDLIPTTKPELKRLYWACVSSEMAIVGCLWLIFLKSLEQKKTDGD